MRAPQVCDEDAVQVGNPLGDACNSMADQIWVSSPAAALLGLPLHEDRNDLDQLHRLLALLLGFTVPLTCGRR